MKTIEELNAEKDALLEKIRHRREALQPVQTVVETKTRLTRARQDGFPRSHTFRFLTRYPAATALVLVALAALGPRKTLRHAFAGQGNISAALAAEKPALMPLLSILPHLTRLMGMR
ncbi:hypothetical protein BH11PSE11_BH11PSE11_21190 [soil metagenome]